MSTVVWFGGRFVSPEEVTVGIDDRGYLLGDGVFATMRAYAGRCFRASVHLDGLVRGAGLLGLELPLPAPRVAEIADEAARRLGGDAMVRVTLTRGDKLSVLARPIDEPPPSVAVVSVTLRRRAPLDPVVKTTSYALEIAARREAEAAGAYEGLQLGATGELACGAMSNVFVVAKDALYTPSLASGCRDGVTRRAVIALAPRAGLTVREERLDPAILREAEEVFLTNARFECLAVRSIDGRALAGDFPRTERLRALYREEARA